MSIDCATYSPTDGVPDPVAPYSHVVRHGGLLYVTGQMPIDPTTGAVPEGITAQTDMVMSNLARVLELSGCGLGSVLMVRAYLTGMELYPEFNTAYARWFREPLPARTCIAILGLAVGALVEIDMVAATDGSIRA